MKRLVRAVVGVALLVGGSAAPAGAVGTGQAYISGFGGFSPGVGLVGVAGAYQSWYFGGYATGTFQAGTVAAVGNPYCYAYLDSTLSETAVAGAGAGSLDCYGGVTVADVNSTWGYMYMPCAIAYTRVELTVTVTGSCTLSLSNGWVYGYEPVAVTMTLQLYWSDYYPNLHFTFDGAMSVVPE
jgi:hypothetical protein